RDDLPDARLHVADCARERAPVRGARVARVAELFEGRRLEVAELLALLHGEVREPPDLGGGDEIAAAAVEAAIAAAAEALHAEPGERQRRDEDEPDDDDSSAHEKAFRSCGMRSKRRDSLAQRRRATEARRSIPWISAVRVPAALRLCARLPSSSKSTHQNTP